MATTYTETSSTVTKEKWDTAEWYDSRYYKAGMALMLAVAVFWIWYQRTFAYSHGMD
jgi:methane/ammonia monooxygenase subunit C